MRRPKWHWIGGAGRTHCGIRYAGGPWEPNPIRVLTDWADREDVTCKACRKEVARREAILRWETGLGRFLAKEEK